MYTHYTFISRNENRCKIYIFPNNNNSTFQTSFDTTYQTYKRFIVQRYIVGIHFHTVYNKTLITVNNV